MPDEKADVDFGIGCPLVRARHRLNDTCQHLSCFDGTPLGNLVKSSHVSHLRESQGEVNRVPFQPAHRMELPVEIEEGEVAQLALGHVEAVEVV